MDESSSAIRMQLARQVAHWTVAAADMRNLEDLAAPTAWNALERYLGVCIRTHLTGVVDQLKRQAELLQAALDAASSPRELDAVRERLLAFRRQYARVEVTLDFYADAINSRTNPTIGSFLRACDTLAHRSMTQLLDQLNKPAPVVLTYLDKGMGASILKAGLRLWDGSSESPVAAVKIVRHNMHRPTSLIHETGHQVAHIVGWNDELAEALQSELGEAPPALAGAWSGWASEIAADAFAFVHTGYASVAALHDVIAGDAATVLRCVPGDPHPVGYLRVLLGVEMCRRCYGTGPWDDLELAWRRNYGLAHAGPATARLVQASLPFLPRLAELTLLRPMKAFAGHALGDLINPARVSPSTLEDLERRLGAALYNSMHWIWTEALRLLALTGLRAATRPRQTPEMLKQQEAWMLRLGGALNAA